MSQQNSISSIDQKSMGSIKNNPWIKGSVRKKFKKTKPVATEPRYSGKNRISSILHKWNSQQTQIEERFTKTEPSPKKKIYHIESHDVKSESELIKTNEADTQHIASTIQHTTDEITSTQQISVRMSNDNDALQSEIHILKQTIKDLKAQINTLAETVNQLQISLETVESKHEVVVLKEEIESLRDNLAAKKQDITNNKEKEKVIDVLQRRIKENENEMRNMNKEKEDRISELMKEYTLKINEVNQYERQMEELQKELKEEKAQNDSLQKHSEIDGLKQKLTEIRENKDNKIIELSDVIEERNKELKDHEKYINELKKRNDELMQRTQNMESLLERVKSLELENEVLKQQKIEYKEDYIEYVQSDNDEYVDINPDLPDQRGTDIHINVTEILTNPTDEYTEITNVEYNGFDDDDDIAATDFVDVENEDNNDEFVDLQNEQTI